MDNPLTDFPILIYLSDSSGINGENISFVFDELGTNSLKIAVTLNDGLTECYVEVEKWDLGNRGAWLWAKIASISNITDTDIYLYYDNDHADNNAKVGITNSVPAENVWDSDYELVYHMRDDPDVSNVRDSTTNDEDGSKEGANEPIVSTDGMVDDAQNFDGSDDWIRRANAPVPTVLTWTAWVWAGTLGEGAPVFRKIMGYTNRPLLAYAVGTDDWYMVTSATTFVLVNDPQASVEGNWRFLVARYDGTDAFLYVYNTTGLIGTATTVGTIGYDSATLYIGQQGDDTRLWTGLIDELRISKIVRGDEWIRATYETGMDDLLDYGAEEEVSVIYTPTKLFGAGFNASIPHVDLYWKTNLTDITLFEVQNSTDKISWDYLGQNTTAEYHDFEVVNGTERYYRVRACNFTGGAWSNSSWSDIDYEKVYFPEDVGGVTEINITGAWVDYNFTSIVTVVGDNVTGFLNSTYFKDGDFYSAYEVTGAPGYDIRFNVTGLPDNLICICLDLFMYYDGSGGHTFQIEVWNFTDSNWDFIEIIPDECCQWFNNTLECVPNDYVQNGTLMGRFYHPSPGNVNHVWGIDYGKLRVYVPYEVECEEVPATLAMGRYYALAIILLILGILLGLGMRRKR